MRYAHFGRLKVTLYFVVALALSACATQPQEPVTGVQSVGVISAIGDELQISYIGTTAFENKKEFFDINDWGLDKFVSQHAEEKLREKYTVRPVTFNKSGFVAESFGTFARGLDAAAAVEEHVQKDVSPQPDIYIVIYLSEIYDDTMRGNPRFRGPVLHQENFLGRKGTMVAIGAYMSLIDSKTGEEVRETIFAPYSEHRTDRSMGIVRIMRFVDNSLFADTFETLSDEQKTGIKSEMSKLLGDTVDDTLYRIGLTPNPKPSS